MKRIHLLLAGSLGLVLTLTACGSSGSSNKSSAATQPSVTTSGSASGTSSAFPTQPGSIIVGSADFPESVLLADIYADAMTAKGVSVTKKLNVGERPAYMTALQDGSIEFIPEYTGSILDFLNPDAVVKKPDAVFSALQSVASAKGYTVLDFASAQDSDTITVTKATADKYHLTSIGDLKSVAAQLTLGAPAQFKTRPDGVPALKSVYGVVFGRFTPLAAGGAITVTALKNGSVDAADIFSTDPAILANGFISLQDPDSMFGAQNIVPMAKTSKLSQPMVDACNAVSAKLDTPTLARLVAEVVTNKKDPDTVAKAWLGTVGLG